MLTGLQQLAWVPQREDLRVTGGATGICLQLYKVTTPAEIPGVKAAQRSNMVEIKVEFVWTVLICRGMSVVYGGGLSHDRHTMIPVFYFLPL